MFLQAAAFVASSELKIAVGNQIVSRGQIHMPAPVFTRRRRAKQEREPDNGNKSRDEKKASRIKIKPS